MLRARRRRNDAAKSPRFKDSHDFQNGLPEKFSVLEGLARDHYINSLGFEFVPMVGVVQHDVYIFPSLEIGADILPWRSIKKGSIRAIIIGAAKIDNLQRLASQGAEIIAAEIRHLIVRTWVHQSKEQTSTACGRNCELQRRTHLAKQSKN